MSFSCPHFTPDDEQCLRLKTDCVPGRPGCVIPRTTVFAVPAEEQIRALEEEKRQRVWDAVAASVQRRQQGAKKSEE